MDTRDLRKPRHTVFGAAQPINLAIIAVLVLLAIAAWLLIIKPHQQLMEVESISHDPAPTAAAAQGEPAPVNVAAMNLNQLLTEARKAMNEQRVLAPAGNNAFEFYLKALEKQPSNPVATDALRETFPFAANSAEQEINRRDFSQAQRQIDLLAKADPANYTLIILRSKLDAQRKVLDKQQQQQLDQQQLDQQQIAAQKAISDQPADKLQVDAQAAQQQTKDDLDAQKTQQEPIEAAQQQSAQAVVDAKPENSQNAEQTRAAVLLKSVLPSYPTAALRAAQEGWVDVDFSVAPDGSVTDLKVTNAQPSRIFDRAAMDAVAQWRFTPALKDGAPVTINMHRRIEFKLGQ